MSFIALDYFCRCGRLSESLELRSAPAASRPCDCGGEALRCLSPVRSKTCWASVSQGKPEEPPSPLATDTRALADRQLATGEWRQKRKAQWRDLRRSQLR